MGNRESLAGRALYIRDIRASLKDKFKLACATRGETMTDVMVRFIKKYIRMSKHLQIPRDHRIDHAQIARVKANRKAQRLHKKRRSA